MRTIAERIRRSKKSLKKISEESQIALPRLSEIIESKEPTLTELRRLAVTLKLELSDFLETNSSPNQTALLFRQTMGNKLKDSHLPAVEVLSHQMEQSLELLSNHSCPDWLKPFQVTKHDYPNAQRLAREFRTLFFGDDQFSPIFELPKIAVERLGVILLVTPNLKIDGASAIVNGTVFVFISPRFCPRMLFTLAHELGHLVAHHQTSNNFAFFDAEESTGRFLPEEGTKERFVDAFASCLLLPSRGIGITLKKIRQMFSIEGDNLGDVELLYLSHIYGVSFQVAAKRCEDIGLVPRGSALSLYERVCREHGSPEKRAKELNLSPRPDIEFPKVPTRLLESAAQKIRSGEISIGRAAKSLKLTLPTFVEEYSHTLAS